MKFAIASVLLIAFIYINVLGMFKGYKEIPEGKYKHTLWKYKKIELIEKGIISAILVFVVFSMGWSNELAAIALAAMVIIMIIEYFFGKYIRKSFICPNCGAPVWTGNFIVILRAKRQCYECGCKFVDEENKAVNKNDENEEE
ncbi:hypothetical protein [Emergencia sp.]|uniref:hypothetical protein n=1 Tax=Emergencia sp. TaxID=1926557 RepID=UPI003AF004A8